MRLVIIEAPFRNSPAPQTYLRDCIRDTLRRGESAYTSVPIYALTGALDDATPAERRMGIAAGLEWYRKADCCAVYEDFGISVGMKEGIIRAMGLGVPVEIRRLYPIAEKVA